MPLAATAGMDGKLCIWELNTFSLRHTCAHGAGVVELLWRKESPLLLSCTVSREIRLWDARSAECLKVLTGHRDAVLCMAVGYTPGATYLVSGSDDHTARVWSIDV
jgi:WD40 repeat protein